MSATFEIDSRGFGEQLRQLVPYTRKTMADVIRQQVKLLIRDVAKMTPPFGTSPVMEAYNIQRKIGMAAVERDVRRAFRGPDDLLKNPLVKNNPKLEVRLRRYIATGDWPKIEKIARDFGFNIPVLREPDEQLFDRNRDRRGRYRRNTPLAIVTSKRALEAFIKLKQSHVGKAKSGWEVAASRAGVKLPNWITKHSGQGLYIDRLDARHSPSVTVGNLVDFIQNSGQELRIMKRGVDNRIRNMRVAMEKAIAAQWARRNRSLTVGP